MIWGENLNDHVSGCFGHFIPIPLHRISEQLKIEIWFLQQIPRKTKISCQNNGLKDKKLGRLKHWLIQTKYVLIIFKDSIKSQLKIFGAGTRKFDAGKKQNWCWKQKIWCWHQKYLVLAPIPKKWFWCQQHFLFGAGNKFKKIWC